LLSKALATGDIKVPLYIALEFLFYADYCHNIHRNNICLGRGDYDVALTNSFNFPRGYVKDVNISYYTVANEWHDLDNNVRLHVSIILL